MTASNRFAHIVTPAAVVGAALLAAGCASTGAGSPTVQPTWAAEHAAELERQACAEGALRGSTRPEVLVEAATLLARDCENGKLDRCSVLGVMAETGRGTKVDPARAARLFEHACSGGNPRACVNLGVLYAQGAGVIPNPRAARSLYTLACNDGDAEGCFHLGRLYARGENLAPDPAYAEALLGRSCTAGHAGACLELGAMYEQGVGQKPDPVRALRHYDRACRSGDIVACFLADRLRPSRPRSSTAQGTALARVPINGG